MFSTRAWPRSRWLTGGLGLLLAVLSGAAAWTSWRQTATVAAVVASSRETDACQQAAFLAATEMALIQAALLAPDGPERARVEPVGRLVDEAMARLVAVDDDDARLTGLLRQMHVNQSPYVRYFLSQLDRHETAGARHTLDAVLEPASARISAGLLDVQTRHLAETARDQASAEALSGRLLGGSVVVFGVGLAVLVLFAWSIRAHRREVEAMAATDGLTGLPNRGAFLAAARAALAGPRAPTVLLVDLDGFRAVNDQLGHGVGDRLLIETGRRLAAAVRDDDLVARLGGDEFAVLLRHAGAETGEVIAARLAEAFDEPFALDDFTVDLEISIGGATAQPGDRVTALLQHADVALHTAKQEHTTFHRFAAVDADTAAARLGLLGDLRRALDDPDQLFLHYQPQIALNGGAVAGVEALARWRHPRAGMISPADFVPVLENTSLIHRFTDLVLTRALAQARTWLDAGTRIPVAVNISTRSLLDPGFADRVAALLGSAGVPGDLLCIEITEYTVMRDPATATEALLRIRELGVRTSIDDFGTGYSSMSYLKLLPVDELKIDRSFVADMATDPSSHALVASIVELSHHLGLVVVAEGVEDAATADALRRLGCELAQGFHFAAPAEPAALDCRPVSQPA